MIASVFPTIGKTILSKHHCLYVDLNSKNFNEIKAVYTDWWKIYCDIALDLEKQGYVVLIWTKNNIHEYLQQRAKQYCMIMYDISLKEEVLSKAKTREIFDPQPGTYSFILKNFDKTYQDLLNISQQHNIELHLISSMDYNLEDILKESMYE